MYKVWNSLLNCFHLSFSDRLIRDEFIVLNKKNHFKSDKIILIPLIDDLALMKLIINIKNNINSDAEKKVKYFYVKTAIDDNFVFKNIFSKNLNKVLNSRYFLQWKTCRKYNIKITDLLVSNYFSYSEKPKRHVINNKTEILNFVYKNVLIGDLIYDTYLRFQKKSTLILSDKKLLFIINYSTRLFNKWESLFKKVKIDTLLIPYTSYIHWGIPSRLALINKINVFVFGSNNYFVKKLNSNHPFQSKDYQFYHTNFLKINNPKVKLYNAEKELTDRLSGSITNGISYMKTSAYKNKNTDFKLDVSKPFAVIFLHCFFDSPHIYGDGLFTDFHEWLNFILDQAKSKKNVNFYVKEHPNALPENKEIVDEFKNEYLKYNNIFFIESSVSNNIIAQKKPLAIFTFYGTIAHEFAFLGIPVINAGINPHYNYNFNYNPKNISQYLEFINDIENISLPPKYDRIEILEFYYMHYMYYSRFYDSTNCSFIKDFTSGFFFISDNIKIDDIIYENS